MTYTLTPDTPAAMAEELNSRSNVELLDNLSARQQTLLNTALENYDSDLPVLTVGRYPPRNQLSDRYWNRHEKRPAKLTVIGIKYDRTGNVDLRIVVPRTDADE